MTYIIYAFSGVITAIISIYLLGGGGLMVFRPYGTLWSSLLMHPYGL